MSKANVLFRNADQVEQLVKFYNEQKVTFKVKHSQYSTTFDFGKEKIKFVTQTYGIRVFAANRALVKDIKSSPDTLELLTKYYSTDNYDVRNGLKPKNYGKVINVDIVGAYPNTLINNGLCTFETYKRLMKLPKKERLPAIGMIAKKATVFSYENGECTEWDVEVGEFANIFYFLIYEIDRIMKFCKEIAGEYYIMHWVDGIFLEHYTPRSILDEIQDFLKKHKYLYRFENISSFKVVREDDMLNFEITKNKELKSFKFADKRMNENYNEILNVLQNDTLFLQRDTTPDLQLPEGVQAADFQDLFK
jgi:hypothetical protein